MPAGQACPNGAGTANLMDPLAESSTTIDDPVSRARARSRLGTSFTTQNGTGRHCVREGKGAGSLPISPFDVTCRPHQPSKTRQLWRIIPTRKLHRNAQNFTLATIQVLACWMRGDCLLKSRSSSTWHDSAEQASKQAIESRDNQKGAPVNKSDLFASTAASMLAHHDLDLPWRIPASSSYLSHRCNGQFVGSLFYGSYWSRPYHSIFQERRLIHIFPTCLLPGRLVVGGSSPTSSSYSS